MLTIENYLWLVYSLAPKIPNWDAFGNAMMNYSSMPILKTTYTIHVKQWPSFYLGEDKWERTYEEK